MEWSERIIGTAVTKVVARAKTLLLYCNAENIQKVKKIDYI